MTCESAAFRRPYRRGDYLLVDTTSQGTYWQSPDGVVIRMASGEDERFDGGEYSVDDEAVKGR